MNIEHKFYDAVYKGDMEMVQAMFKKYVIHIDEIYPLKRAFKAGHLAMLQDLIQAGANVNWSLGSYNTILHAACINEHCNSVEMMQELLKAGINVNQ